MTQHFATSKDGTVPYFQVSNTSKTELWSNLLYGYGGLKCRCCHVYNASVGTAWLNKGGTYVVANIRGGGEYEPAGSGCTREIVTAYEDFVAVEGLVSAASTSDELGSKGVPTVVC